MVTDEFGFLKQLAFALQSTDIKPADKALFAQFERIGLTQKGFDPSKLSDASRKGMARGLKDGPSVAVASLASTSSMRSGWNWLTGLDSFGYDYPLRALVAGNQRPTRVPRPYGRGKRRLSLAHGAAPGPAVVSARPSHTRIARA